MRAIIYLRTSTKDQNPELQKDDCVQFCSNMGLEIVDIVSEQGSAYKLEKIRPEWESVQERAKKEKLDIVVWRYDRSFRNRQEFYKFMRIMFEVYGTKVYSVTEPSILSLWDMMDKTNTGNPIVDEFLKGQMKVMWNFMIQNAGEQAEEESRKKSERVKLAVKKENGVTKSYKGNKWGRKAIKVDERIISLSEKGKSIREICKEIYYWDKTRHKKFVSIGYVQNILAGVQKLSGQKKEDLNIANSSASI